jgi:5-methylcytosine-specific restriction endonuclease McrA
MEQVLKQRFAQVRTPRKPRSNSSNKLGVRRRTLKSRYIPRAVVREVHERDGEQCTFVSSDGKRCGERGYLELHHRNPFARGGEATAANLTLLCRCHNSLLAERDFRAGFMRSKRLQAPGPSRELLPNPNLNSFQNEFSR